MARRSWDKDQSDSGKLFVQAVALFVVLLAAGFFGRYLWQQYEAAQVAAALGAIAEEVQRAERQSAQDRRRSAEANERAERRRAEEARLKPGERCMGGRFARQIDGDTRRWESDSSQDWKCNRRR